MSGVEGAAEKWAAKRKFWIKQDRQCTYNVTMRRVRVTIVAVEKQ